jgi:branched-subunit amino acid ABC-type transport system permease component
MARQSRLRGVRCLGAWKLIASGLITGGIYALVALGLNLQYGLMRILNIAHGEFLMLGAYLTWMVQTQFGLSAAADGAGVVCHADGAGLGDPPAVLSAG